MQKIKKRVCLFSFLLLLGLLACREKVVLTTSPEWSQGIVWYQIFPERFANGDTTNGPDLTDQQGCWPHELIEPWQVHPWGSDWYQMQDYEKANSKDLWYNITRRRYGGDLQGIINKLDYLKDLGVGGIYLNPIFVSPSHHKYDVAYYHHVEPTFGPDPKGDWEIIKAEIPDDPDTWQWTAADSLLLKLIDEAHKRNIRLILDGVFNHVGYNNFAFQDVKKNQQNSRFKDWFTVYSWEDSSSSFEYQGWWGVKDMPELREDSNGLMPGPRKYIFDITKRWMNPADNGDVSKGIDGWRLDVADQVGHPFWKDWRKHVKSINPGAFITGEITLDVEELKPYLGGDEFDASMNYNFAFLLGDYFVNDSMKLSTSEFDSLLGNLREAFQNEISLNQQNLLGSHDSHRAASRFVNKNKGSYRDKHFFFEMGKANNNRFKTRKPTAEEYKKLQQMLIFQMTYPGSPMIYYGDEVGMWGAHDPCCRKPMIWDDVEYQDESLDYDGSKKTKIDQVGVNKELLAFYKKLISIRKNNPALQKGDFKTLFIDDLNKIYAFSRTYNNEEIIVAFNNSDQNQQVEIESKGKTKAFDVLNNMPLEINKQKISVQISRNWAAIIKNKTQ
jgi:cyclomaltodextrinase / maltogenic alpha-amylase / neopullulanase